MGDVVSVGCMDDEAVHVGECGERFGGKDGRAILCFSGMSLEHVSVEPFSKNLTKHARNSLILISNYEIPEEIQVN